MNCLPSPSAHSSALNTFAVIINTTHDREVHLKSLINPLLHWVDSSNEIIQVTSNFKRIGNKALLAQHNNRSEPLVPQRAIVPAISIILFLSEHGHHSYHDVRKHVLKHPWKFHHKIELTSRRTPNFNVARQEYFFLDDGQPLWSVNPVHRGNEHLRVCVFTCNFIKMVEFYRLVTEREMESTKPGFCTFALFNINDVGVQLAIKYSPNIQPVPMDSTILFLKIKDIRSIYPSDEKIAIHANNGRYIVTDPDGNCLVLQETKQNYIFPMICEVHPFPSTQTDSHSESQDSGRWSSSVKQVSKCENCRLKSPLHTAETSDTELCCQTKLYSCTACGPLSETLYKNPVSCDGEKNFKEVWL